MLVSCVCPTYHHQQRSHLLAEAVESFLRQDWQEKELIIVNDSPSELLIFEHPQVHIFNLDIRFKSLGEKRNWGIAQSGGDWIFPWDDDDVCLPHRISRTMANRKEGIQHLLPEKGWYWPNKRLEYDRGPPSSCAFSRVGWQLVGGYPTISVGEDQGIEGKFRDLDAFYIFPCAPEDAFYLYRWENGSIHLSGTNEPYSFYDRLASIPVSPGRYHLRPAWYGDYLNQIASACYQVREGV